MAAVTGNRRGMRIHYETGACGRCGGSGEYSFNPMDGTTCFGCRGSGERFTRNGRRACNAVSKFIHDRYAKPIEEIVARSQVRLSTGERWRVVLDNTLHRSGQWVLYTRKITHYVEAGTLIDIRPTPEQFIDELVPFARRFSGVTIMEDGE